MKKIFAFILLVMALGLFACSSKKEATQKIYVFNAGEYIDPEVITNFEKEYGIKVVYDLFENNEDIYPIVEVGSTHYDCICPSDYMIQKLMQNNLLQKIDFSKVPNYAYIKETSKNNAKKFDANNEYCIPYMEGTVGIVCNKTLLREKNLPIPTSWSDLWNKNYKDEILMQNNIRDCMMVSLKKNGYSLNSKNTKEIDEATNDLIKQKPLVQAYVIDQVRDKMVSGEALLGVVYSGELLEILNEANGQYEYEYVLPKEGTNVWIDAWVIPKDSQNVDNAHLWLNYMCREDVAKKNAQYITYDTTNEKAFNDLKEMYDKKTNITKDYTNNNNEVYNYLGQETEEYYNSAWKSLKSH